MNLDRKKLLVSKLQSGECTAREEHELCLEIENCYRPHKIDNYLHSQDELKSDYMIAAWSALHRAKLGVGDPVMFAVRRGNGAMLDYYRSVSNKRLRKRCSCGLDHRYSAKSCKACGDTDMESFDIEQTGELLDTMPAPEVTETSSVDELIEEILTKVDGMDLTTEESWLAKSAIKNRTRISGLASMNGMRAAKAEALESRVFSLL